MASNPVQWVKKYSVAIAFAALAAAGAVGIDASAKHEATSSALVVYDSQLRACKRANALRHEINRRVDVVAVQRSVLLQFIESADTARRANYKTSRKASDKKAADTYKQLAAKVRSTIHYATVPLIDCAKVIKKP